MSWYKVWFCSLAPRSCLYWAPWALVMGSQRLSLLGGNKSHTFSYLFIPGECVSRQGDPGKALLVLTINRGTLWKSSLRLPSLTKRCQASGKVLFCPLTL